MLILSKADEKKVKNLRAPRRVAAASPTRDDALGYFQVIQDLDSNLVDVSKSLQDLIDEGASPREVRDFLNTQHDKMTDKYGKASLLLAPAFVRRLDKRNKARNEASIARALTLDPANIRILDNKAMDDIRELSVLENVQLIRSIPQEYFSKVANPEQS